MKKKILIIVSIVCIVMLGWLGYEIYAYYNPEYGFKVATPDSTTDMYIEHLNFYINEKSIFGAPKEIYVKSAEIVDGAYMIYTEIISKYTAPMNVKVSYTFEFMLKRAMGYKISMFIPEILKTLLIYEIPAFIVTMIVTFIYELTVNDVKTWINNISGGLYIIIIVFAAVVFLLSVVPLKWISKEHPSDYVSSRE